MTLPFLGLNHLFISPNKEQFNHEGQSKSISKQHSVEIDKLINKRSGSIRKYALKIHPIQSSISQQSYNSNNSDNTVIINNNNNNEYEYHFRRNNSNRTNNSNNSETSDDDSESSSDSDSFLNNDLFNNSNNANIEMYLILTRQREEAIKKAHFLEKKLKEQDVAYALNFDQFNHQIKQYKHTNYRLQTENIKLKNELQIFENKLHYKLAYLDGMQQIEHKYNNENSVEFLLQKRERLSKPKPQVPQFIQKEYKKESDTNIVCSMEEQYIYNYELPSIKPPNTHIRQLTTIMEHKQIPLGLLMSSNQHMQHHMTDININTKKLWENDNTRQRSITYI